MDEKKQDVLLKYTETADMIGAGAVMVGYYFEFSSKPYGQILLIIGFGALAASSFLRMNPGLNKSEDDPSEILIKKLVVIGAAVGMMASLFKIMYWPNYTLMFYTFFGAVGGLIILSLMKSKNPSNFVPFNELLKIAGAFLVFFLL